MSEKPNAAGLIVSGDKNPNWKGWENRKGLFRMWQAISG